MVNKINKGGSTIAVLPLSVYAQRVTRELGTTGYLKALQMSHRVHLLAQIQNANPNVFC